MLAFSLLAITIALSQPREIQASIPGGTATTHLEPSTGTYSVGESFSMEIKIDSQSVNISGAQIYLEYQYDGDSPELEVQDSDPLTAGVQISPGDPPFNYITNEVIVDTATKKVTIGLAGVTTGQYATGGSVTFGVVNFKAVAAVESRVISFKPTFCYITERNDGQDILKTPAATAIYTVSSTGPTPTSDLCPGGSLGDLNCDGLIEGNDINLLLQAWSPTGPIPTPITDLVSADLNNDNRVDENDLSILLFNWGTTF